jgi:hypothetical protein
MDKATKKFTILTSNVHESTNHVNSLWICIYNGLKESLELFHLKPKGSDASPAVQFVQNCYLRSFVFLLNIVLVGY